MVMLHRNHLLANSSLSVTSQQDISSASTTKSSFVQKLYAILNSNEYYTLISWSFTGNSFIVSNAAEFATQVLPKHYKHGNFNSFVRQLNMYGFHKVNKPGRTKKQELQYWEFSHPRFQRSKPELLETIFRKATADETLDSKSPSGEESPSLTGRIDSILMEVTAIKKKQDVQNEMIRYLFKKVYNEGRFDLFEKHVRNKVDNSGRSSVPSTPDTTLKTMDFSGAINQNLSSPQIKERASSLTQDITGQSEYTFSPQSRHLRQVSPRFSPYPPTAPLQHQNAWSQALNSIDYSDQDIQNVIGVVQQLPFP